MREIASVFLKLGLTSFGGPAAHVALMENELVSRRAWLEREHFLDLYAASQLIPGPNSTELALHLGLMRGGWRGFFTAGFCFILPAALLVSLFAYLYEAWGQLPAFNALLYGIKPVIIAILLQALWTLGKSALKSRALIFIGAFAAALSLAGIGELAVLLLSGFAYASWQRSRFGAQLEAGSLLGGALAILPLSAGWGGLLTIGAPSLLGLFFCFLKAGSLLFGGGYVLLAFLRADLVESLRWLSETQLLDAIAVGQFTPGPLFTTATFIGYILKGPQGALVATIGIFLPAFVAVALSAPYIPKLRRSPVAAAVLDGLNVASLALMAIATFALSQLSLRDFFSLGLTALSLGLLLRWKVSSSWLVLAGGVLGYVWKWGATGL